MARSKAGERPNPYAELPADGLEEVYRTLLAAYVERLEYFAGLPAWMFSEFGQINERGPAAYGMTRGEWERFCADRWLHIREGAKLGHARAERSKRLREAARRAVSSCPDLGAAEAARESLRAPYGPQCHHRADGEGIGAYVARMEMHEDDMARERGAWGGYDEAFERDLREMVEGLVHG